LRLETIAAAGSEGMQIAALDNRAFARCCSRADRIAPTVVPFLRGRAHPMLHGATGS